ncbi:hypothetical protein K504DRAFT_25155 [Pleomassaria siparia CBS 279.74]|uniref:Uncharacterized protein n=1 Tax=Pleomassaria siparia CBS 279.74 TaxID=1314801 RepID=A0A6G1KS36_9PLEO|nr:hypothetical protein K504DRAFT_25155 [Pleomassaria siparia CBS 279.74]
MMREGEFRGSMSCIERTQPTSDETAPWQGITFKWHVSSDLLAERLKYEFPHCQTLRQRKHQAAIQFLTRELEEMRLKDGQHSTPDASSSYNLESPQSDSNDQVSTGSTRKNAWPRTSPTTPDSLHAQNLTDRSRLPMDQSFNPITTTSAQTIVFSAIDGRTLQPKTKRRMTSPERVMYKETRKRGACEKCKRMKGRCTHDDHTDEISSKPATKRKSISKRNQEPFAGSKVRKPKASSITRTSGHTAQTASYIPISTIHSDSASPAHLPASMAEDLLCREDRDWEDEPKQLLSRSSTSSQDDDSSSNTPTPSVTSPATSTDTPRK